MYDFAAMEADPEYGGWGYLGHKLRTPESDAKLVAAAEALDLEQSDLFLWANCRWARHFMDGYDEARTPATAFEVALARDLPALYGHPSGPRSSPLRPLRKKARA